MSENQMPLEMVELIIPPRPILMTIDQHELKDHVKLYHV